MTYKKIMVTGSTGVLGAAMRTISIDYPSFEFTFLASKDCDLTDMPATLKIVERHAPDAIIHLAAVSGGIGLSMKHHASMLRDNILMTFSILEAARKTNVKKTIMTLTTGMYPVDAPLPLNEVNIHNGRPDNSNYGSSFAKRIIDPAIQSYREEFGLNVVGLIPSGIFGENDNFNYDDAPMLPSLIRRFYENRDSDSPITIWGDGKPLREYTYSRDLAQIYLWALQNYNDEQVLNIGTTEELSVAEIAYMIADFMNVDRQRIAFDTAKPRGIYRKNTDNSRFIALSGFEYTPFREGLRRTIQWFSHTYENNKECIRMYNKSKLE